MRDGLNRYRDAWELLPDPKEDWEAATWILSAIGDTQFMIHDYRGAELSLRHAMRCPRAIGNPFIHLRLGQSCYELGDWPRAQDELARAYMGGGAELFAKEDPKFLELIRSYLKPTAGREVL